MTPAITAVRLTSASHRAQLPLLVLGPSCGADAAVLWADCAGHLSDAFDVVAWDLPGHGHNRAVPQEEITVADLARGVLAVVDDLLDHRGESGGSFSHVGVALGGAVGLQLLLDAPHRVRSVVLLGTCTRLDAADRPVPAWLAPGFDVSDRLDETTAPVLTLEELLPAQAPERVAVLIRRHLLGEEAPRDLPALVASWGWPPTELAPHAGALVSLAALVVAGDREGLTAHLRVARAAGLGDDELRACVVQAAAHVDLALADVAFRITSEVLDGGSALRRRQVAQPGEVGQGRPGRGPQPHEDVVQRW